MGGDYKPVGSSEDVVNTNAYTGQMTDLLQQTLSGNGSLATSLIQSILKSGGQNDFLGVLNDPRLNGVIGSYGTERNSLAELAAQNTQRRIASQYAGGSLYSGAFGEALGRGVGEAYQGAATDIAGKQLGLYNSAMGLSAQGQQQAYGSALGYYGGLQNSALQGLTAYGAPNWYDQTYAYKPGFLDYLFQGIGAASQGAAGTAALLMALG